MALFFANDRKELMPIAIQLFQKPADINPVSLISQLDTNRFSKRTSLHMLLEIGTASVGFNVKYDFSWC